MAVAELARPGVEVVQAFRTTSPTYLRPTLAPVVVGPAFEVLTVLTADGTLNSKARYGNYYQLGKTITQSSFPDPRANIDELVVQASSIRAYMLAGGKLGELLMNPGEGFLAASHIASKAAFRVVGTSFAVGGKTLVIAVDQPSRTSTALDVTITFPGTGSLSAADVVAEINSAYGSGIASLVLDGLGATTGIQIASPSYGALSSITIRAGGSANQALTLGWSAAAAHEERMEGTGYRAQNQNDGTTQSFWVEPAAGRYLLDGAATAFVAGKTGLFNILAPTTFVDTAPGAMPTFGGAGTVPLAVGDQVFCDGVRLVSGNVMKVEGSRFKIGVINTSLSVADSRGRYTTAVYDPVKVGTLWDVSPFVPKYVWYKACNLPTTASATKASVTGSVTGNVATVAHVMGGVVTTPATLQGLTIHYVVTRNGVVTDGTFTFTGGPYAAVSNIVTAIGTNIPGVVATEGTAGDAGKLIFSTSLTGRTQAITIKADGTANTALNFSAVTDTTGTGTDVQFPTTLTGTILNFAFDKSPHTYQVIFTDESLDLAVDSINATVGATVASKNGTGRQLVLTSPLAGLGSEVKVLAGTANTVVGYTDNQTAAGTGRPYPDAYLDGLNNLVIGSEILRDPVTGYPLDFVTNSAVLYIQYTALRRDVSPLAQVPGVLRLTDTTTLAAVLNPVDERNPLSLAAFLCMLNAPNFEIKALGVDDVTAAAPTGTELAYARCATQLESEEVYAIAPLTQNEVVHGTFQTHVTLMSDPTQGGERILFQNKVMPTRKNPRIAASGSSASATQVANQLLLDVTPAQGLVDLGLNPALPFTAADGVYVEFSWASVLYRYSVVSVSGALVNLRTTFSPGENDDYFYATSALPADVLNAAWSMKVRGASLVIPGSNPARLDYSLVASTVAEANQGVLNRRVYSVFPDTIKTTVNGIEKTLAGYYACAAIAGMVGGQPPQQGFTNFPITGLTGVVGTEKFTKRQLNIMAGGGTYILMQEVEGGSVFCRHQLSTDTTTVEKRELSVTKIVDFTAKFLRSGIRRFIGRQNINTVFLDTVGTTIQGMLQFLVDNGILNGANLNNIIQDKTNPDTVLVDVTLDVPFPCNYIRLTLMV